VNDQIAVIDRHIRAESWEEAMKEANKTARIYNSNVQAYNTRVQVFPTLLIAGPMSFRTRDFFEIEVAAERAVPRVAF